MSGLTGGHTIGFSPNVAKTALDAVLFENYDRDEQPDILTSRNEMFFNQSSIDRNAFIWEEWSNVGEFSELQEQEEIKTTSVQSANQTTKNVVKFFKSIPVSSEMFEDDIHGTLGQLVQQIGDRARLTQDKKAVLNTYGDGFDGNVNTTPDGQALYSNSHTTVTGSTVDNLLTGALTPDALFTAVQSLINQLGQDGELGSHVFSGIVVPPALYKTVHEVMNSIQEANSAENNLNIFNTVYGTVAIKMTPFLGSTFNSATNADTSYYLISRNHMIMRKVRTSMDTSLIQPEYSTTDSYEYRARYREVSFPGSWTGTVASNGSA